MNLVILVRYAVIHSETTGNDQQPKVRTKDHFPYPPLPCPF